MSRKDHRRVLMVPLSGAEIAWLRGRARGRSLGDALRRTVQSALEGGAMGWTDDTCDRAAASAATGTAMRLLPLQLPRGTRLALGDLARELGWSRGATVRCLLAAAMNPVAASQGWRDCRAVEPCKEQTREGGNAFRDGARSLACGHEGADSGTGSAAN